MENTDISTNEGQLILEPYSPGKSLQGIFGEKCQIIANETNSINISVKLKDGICSGGDVVDVQVLEDNELGRPFNLKDGETLYRTQSFKINGTDCTDYFPEILFLNSGKRPQKQEAPIEYPKVSYDLDGGRIFISSLSTGDDLAALLHETGHDLQMQNAADKTEFRLQTYEQRKLVTFAIWYRKLAPEHKWLVDNKEAVTRAFHAIMSNERDASARGFIVKSDLEKERGVKIFSSDVGSHRLKKCMEVMLLRYLKDGKIAISDTLSHDEVDNYFKPMV